MALNFLVIMWKACICAFYLIVIFVGNGFVISEKLTEKDVRKLLTGEEKSLIFGTSKPDVKFWISYPYVVSKNNTNSIKYIHIETPFLKKTIKLKLVLSHELVPEDFTILETDANGSYAIDNTDVYSNCFYRGEDSAFNLCNGVQGVLYSNKEQLLHIQPLPERLRRDSVLQPHIIFIKHHQTKNCIHSHQQNLAKKEPKLDKSRRRSIRDTSSGTPVFVETAVFIDKDLYLHMKANFPANTERHLIRFVLAMINAVQLLYHDPSLGRQVNFVLKRLEILKEEVSGLVRPPDIDRYLSNFCNWQQSRNPRGDKEPQHWDHALMLTGLDLYVRGKHGKISNQVVGLAPVAGMCTSTSSCTVNEGRHFESVYVVAHEIGHNLGMRHDGPLADNDCDPTTYIMSPTLGSGKITWSQCSKKYLQEFLDTAQSHCLLDHGSSAGQLDHSAEGVLPGERFDSDQQCMLKYGIGSRHSSQQPLNDVCRDLHCERERYTWTSHPALEGTLCGVDMWCKGGRCILRGVSKTLPAHLASSALLARSNKLVGPWSQWKPFSDCASGCLFGEGGRLSSGSTGIMTSSRTCSNSRSYGKNSCEGISRKFQTCIAQQCLNVPRLTIKEFANQICSRAKEVDKDLTGVGIQKTTSNVEDACLVWCYKRNGETTTRSWGFPDGTVCQTSNYYKESSYCINGRCEKFSCNTRSDAAFIQMPELCSNLDNRVSWNTDISTRPTIVKWKSVSDCYFNCISPGSGIRLVANKNKLSKSSIQLCQPRQLNCRRIKSPFQHASMVCNKYKERVRKLSGLGMQISPVIEDPDRPCRIACQDETISHRFYLVNGEEGWFPFGTDCSRTLSNKKAYCVSGKCLEFGGDDTPLSKTEFTLPLLSRSRRSLQHNHTRVIATLNQEQLEDIINDFNRTLMGTLERHPFFDIDLNNPVHIDIDHDPGFSIIQFTNFSNIGYYRDTLFP